LTKYPVLDISWCPAYTSTGLADLVAMGYGCRRLEDIDISGCWGLGKTSVSVLLRFNPNIVSFKMEHCRGLDASVAALDLLAHCPNLQILNISGHATLTDEALIALVKHKSGSSSSSSSSSSGLPSNLRILNLAQCPSITDASIIATAESCAHLRELYLTEVGVTDAALRALADSRCRTKLKLLCLMRNRSVTDNAVEHVVRSCPFMQTIRLAHSSISGETVRFLRRTTNVVY
jgi:hypothetical protein